MSVAVTSATIAPLLEQQTTANAKRKVVDDDPEPPRLKPGTTQTNPEWLAWVSRNLVPRTKESNR